MANGVKNRIIFGQTSGRLRGVGHRLSQTADRADYLMNLGISGRFAIPGWKVVGPQINRSVETVNRLVRSMQLDQRIAPTTPSVIAIRLDGQCLIEAVQGLL